MTSYFTPWPCAIQQLLCECILCVWIVLLLYCHTSSYDHLIIISLFLSLQQIIVRPNSSLTFPISYPHTNYAIGLPSGHYSISVLAVNQHNFSIDYPSNRIELSVNTLSSNSGSLSQVLQNSWLYILAPVMVHLGIRTINH